MVAAIVVVVVIVVAAVGYGVYYFTTSSSSSTPVIRVGTTFGAADTSDVPTVYALTVALKNYGYQSNLNIFTGQQAASAALLSNEVDVVASSPAAFVALSLKNPNIVAIAPSENAIDEILICNKASNITSVSQLVQVHQLTAITSFTDSSYYYIYVWLQQHGYNASQVNWTFVPGAAGRGAALLSGKIPCGATDVGDTVILTSQPNNAFHIVAPLATLIPNVPLSVYFTTKQYLATHQAELLALVKAQIQANRWAQDQNSYTSFAPSVIGSQLNSTQLSKAYGVLHSIGIFDPNDSWNSTIAAKISNIVGTFHLAGAQTMPDPSNWTDFTIYNQAISQLGMSSG
jgi:ABC-type nitrate/sulfonate/bicarbonate transport system substrate-binding protein